MVVLTGARVVFGLLVATAVSVTERVIEGFELLFDFSRLLARTVDPVAEPGKGFLRVVVCDRATLDFV